MLLPNSTVSYYSKGSSNKQIGNYNQSTVNYRDNV